MRNFIKTGGHHDEKRSKTTSKRMDEKIRQKLLSNFYKLYKPLFSLDAYDSIKISTYVSHPSLI